MITRRRLTIVAVVAALALLIYLTPRSEDADSTAALRRFLDEIGLEVSEREGLPSSDGTLVLLADIREVDATAPLLDWAERGGHLVVTDPDSSIVGAVGATSGETLGFVGNVDLEPACIAPVVVGVGRISVRSTDAILRADDPSLVSCFPVGDGALLLTRPYGAGTVTLLGGASAFTNELLREADNAALAAALTSSGSEVVFGPPTAGAPEARGVWDVLPDGARAFLVALAAAAAAFALVRARRLGGPVVEAPITPIPGSDLVRAAGRLYRKGRATDYAGALMRQAAVTRLSRRFVADDARDLAGAVARQTDTPRDHVERVLAGAEPRTDDDLMRLSAELEALSAKAEMRST